MKYFELCPLSCLFTPADIQAALYELCWQVVQGNLKLDLVASVLGDMMVQVFFVSFFLNFYLMVKHIEVFIIFAEMQLVCKLNLAIIHT